MSGLRNRFSTETRYVWLYWYDCMICGRNQIDALHHIISPSSHFYVDGNHNVSVLNSCPIHNQICHIGNEAHLYADQTVKYLLNKVADALLNNLQYEIKDVDRQFVKVYKHLYNERVVKLLLAK